MSSCVEFGKVQRLPIGLEEMPDHTWRSMHNVRLFEDGTRPLHGKFSMWIDEDIRWMEFELFLICDNRVMIHVEGPHRCSLRRMFRIVSSKEYGIALYEALIEKQHAPQELELLGFEHEM